MRNISEGLLYYKPEKKTHFRCVSMSIKKYYKHCYRGSIIARAHLDNISFRTYTQISTIGLHET